MVTMGFAFPALPQMEPSEPQEMVQVLNFSGVPAVAGAPGREKRGQARKAQHVSIHAPSREAASDNAGTSAEIKSRILPDRPCYDRKNILLFTGEGAERQFHALMIT